MDVFAALSVCPTGRAVAGSHVSGVRRDEWCRYRIISGKKGGPCFWLRRAAEEVTKWTGYQQPRGKMGCGDSKHGDVSPSEKVEQELEECRRNSHYHSKVHKARVCVYVSYVNFISLLRRAAICG